MFTKILVANRGAIACRVMRTLRHMGIQSVAVYTGVDAGSRHVLAANESFCIGEGPASESYLDAEKVLAIARECGAQAIHPGYGFLSENATFAEQCCASNIVFLGPTPEQMRTFGLKHTARALAQQWQVPLLPGTGLLDSIEDACRAANHIGYPVMLKSSAGGGGIGMRLCWNEEELIDQYEAVRTLAQSHFNDAAVFLEKFIDQARHIEVQIFGDGRGKVIALGERDCSTQRRNQKIIEETPAPNLAPAIRQAMLAAAIRLGESIHYRSAGTVEFLFDAATGQFYFLEVNTRLQVEHGVTEAVTGIDLVEWMILLGAEALPLLDGVVIKPQGAAIQARIYAENPAKNFQPSSGLLTHVGFPDEVRVETWIESGAEISAYYDPMLAKIIAYADTREQAIDQLKTALDKTLLYGIETNLDYLRQILSSERFRHGQITTRLLADFGYQAHTMEVLSPGLQTTVQDYPGRLGYWHVGVPPSGPMDSLAFRLANRLLDQPDGLAGLEITLAGPTLKFHCDSRIAVCGAQIEIWLNDEVLPCWQAHTVKAGSVLRFGRINGAGSRVYLAVQGGIQVPEYLGSRATFMLGQFGGHGGRVLRPGDMLSILPADSPAVVCHTLAPEWIPKYSHHWDIGVLYGPHGAPDFFTDAAIEMFFSTDWKVHHHSSRTGIRLIGPKPEWARADGGEAGLHPSNIHDNPYTIGAIDFTGDMPIILGPDGPSLGGFVCPAVIAHAELWKIGQLQPGDQVRFYRIDLTQALWLDQQQTALIETLREVAPPFASNWSGYSDQAVLYRLPEMPDLERVEVVYRQAGDRYLLIEYGPSVLDLALRLRVHALMTRLQEAIQEHKLGGIIDITPGIRSLQIHYDPYLLPRQNLLDRLLEIETVLPPASEMEVPGRMVYLPLSWDDRATRLAIEKYAQSVRADAPWCPSNIEFIRRINGLDSIEAVRQIVFDASYLVMGLGDVYLGAPVATPIDPRHRLVTTKYNPARTWTPENAVGIGGAYLCVYGMEGPGGYQLVGRTLQMWNRYRQTKDFRQDHPWLLNFFDQIRFYPVTETELLKIRQDFVTGRFKLSMDDTVFSLKAYQAFLREQDASISQFKARQQAAFEAEYQRWQAQDLLEFASEDVLDQTDTVSEQDLPDGAHAVCSDVTGTIWKLLVASGQPVKSGETLIVIESMKMEIALTAPVDAVVDKVYCKVGDYIAAGQLLLMLQET
ncbi:MAG: urea carboxylase [Nitrosomonas sp.]|nr:urea carboxylase [Nitrosomonas sp.]